MVQDQLICATWTIDKIKVIEHHRLSNFVACIRKYYFRPKISDLDFYRFLYEIQVTYFETE